MDKNSKGFKLIQTRLREVISESGLTLKELAEIGRFRILFEKISRNRRSAHGE